MAEPSRKLSSDEVTALMEGLKTGDLILFDSDNGGFLKIFDSSQKIHHLSNPHQFLIFL